MAGQFDGAHDRLVRLDHHGNAGPGQPDFEAAAGRRLGRGTLGRLEVFAMHRAGRPMLRRVGACLHETAGAAVIDVVACAGMRQQGLDVQSAREVAAIEMQMQRALGNQLAQLVDEGRVLRGARTIVELERPPGPGQHVRHGLERRHAYPAGQQDGVAGIRRQRKRIARHSHGQQVPDPQRLMHGPRPAAPFGFAQHAQNPARPVLRIAGQGIGTHQSPGQVHVDVRARLHRRQRQAFGVDQLEGVDAFGLHPYSADPQLQQLRPGAAVHHHALRQRRVHACLRASTSCCNASIFCMTKPARSSPFMPSASVRICTTWRARWRRSVTSSCVVRPTGRSNTLPEQ